jgi:hypothetical protein
VIGALMVHERDHQRHHGDEGDHEAGTDTDFGVRSAAHSAAHQYSQAAAASGSGGHRGVSPSNRESSSRRPPQSISLAKPIAPAASGKLR